MSKLPDVADHVPYRSQEMPDHRFKMAALHSLSLT